MFFKMKITSIDLHPLILKLKKPFTISLGKVDAGHNVVVVIRTSEGIAGTGECSPFLTINGESMETAMVIGKYLAGALDGADPLDIESCTAVMDRLVYGNSSIKSAFDMALYDIAAQHAGLPLYAFLGGNDRKTLQTDYTISMDTPGQMAADAVWIRDAGFPFIKVKLGNDPATDILRVQAIRQAVGNDIPLRLDANQGWDIPGAIKVLQALEHANIQYCEEPIPRWEYTELEKVRSQSPVPVMADESCCDHHDARRLIGLGACDMINIKLGKSGGIFKAMKIIRLAEEAGIPLMVGGFLESRIGFTASAHLALASDQIRYMDFDSPLMFDEDPVEGGITYQANGVVAMPVEPGLGARLTEK